MVRSPCCSMVGIRRGPWSSKEDTLLSTYIQEHGEGQWKSLPKKAGLLRCGKSCRLRWMNYLRPGIKRGNISEDEEDLIVRLHGLLGNRWSLIAGRLPGRTDNEIKNYWNTYLVKKLNSVQSRGKSKNPAPPQENAKSKKKKKQKKSKKKGEEVEEEPPPPPQKIKVYAPKAIRVTGKFFIDCGKCETPASRASTSDGGGEAVMESEPSFLWSPLLEITDLPFDDGFLVCLRGSINRNLSPAMSTWRTFLVTRCSSTRD